MLTTYKTDMTTVPGGYWPYPSNQTQQPPLEDNIISTLGQRNSTDSSRREGQIQDASTREEVPAVREEVDLEIERPRPLTFATEYQPPQDYRPSNYFQFSTHTLLPLLYGRNLVVKLPQSQKILHQIDQRHHSNHRFTHLKYSAVCGDPDDFTLNDYKLEMDPQQVTEVMIVMTMYNEDEDLFLKTFRACRRNLQYLIQQWGHRDGWRKVIFCVVADGRSKINEKTLAVMGVLGMYQEGLVTSKVQGIDVTAHVFESTCAVGYSSYDNDISPGLCPIQVIFCLKERNQKKINSHRWALRAFGPQLLPRVVVLLDCGTVPITSSLYHLWREFHFHSNVAGACGEIYVKLDWKLLNPLVACQHFEYKISQLLDKRFESACGFISVLPGAFSAYRYEALTQEVLSKYFQGELDESRQNLYYANMYLAEDRVLCHELFTMRNEKWVLRYVQKAMAETDVPSTVSSYILQRRRWINGTFFSNIHSVSNFYQVFRTHHSMGQKIVFLFQTLYNLLMLLLNWFNVATCYLFFYLLTLGYQKSASSSQVDPFFGNSWINIVLNQLYLFSLLAVLIASLGNKPNQSGYLYQVMFLVFSLLSAIMFGLSFIRLYNELSSATFDFGSFFQATSSFRDLFLSVFLILIIFTIISVLYLDPWHMLTSWLPYSILILCSTNILFVYAFSNLSDISWGNRPDERKERPETRVSLHEGTKIANIYLPAHQGEIDSSYRRFFGKLSSTPSRARVKPGMDKEEYFKLYRSRLLLAWIITNSLLVLLVTNDQVAMLIGAKSTTQNNVPLSFFFYSLSAAVVLKAIGSVVYKMQRVVQENKFV